MYVKNQMMKLIRNSENILKLERGNIIKMKSADQENLPIEVRRERKQFYYRISIKPECDAHHRQSANKDRAGLIFFTPFL